MKGLWLAVLLLALMGALLTPGAVGAQTVAQDSVTGSLTEGFGRTQIEWTFSAFSGPSGESPAGTIEAAFVLGPRPTFTVTCLQVAANRAVIGGRESAFGVQVYLIVVDEPGDTQDRILSSFFIDTPPPATCAEFDAQTPIEPGPAQLGSVVVTDARPSPTSKDACKNGGWRSFGTVFRNQGDCVSFVATEGKNPPGGH